MKREWSDDIRELRRMRGELQVVNAGARREVVWATALAHPVVNGAARRARIASATFEAVDRGGLRAVWL